MQCDDSNNEEQEQQISEIIFTEETCASMVKRKTKYFLTNITLEPVMLFYGIIRSIDRVAQSQLIIGQLFIIYPACLSFTLDKTCLNDFDFGEEICDNLLDYDSNNTVVQNEVAQFAVWESIVDHLFPIICSLFLGSWSDNFGRKYLLYLYFFFCMVQTSILKINSLLASRCFIHSK